MNITTNFKHSSMKVPAYASYGAAGFDLQANLIAPVTIQPGDRTLVPTGISAAVPSFYELQIRPRSGMALKYGITVLNTPGTIDSDYRGDIGVILFNSSPYPYIVQPGARIAQGVINGITQESFEVVESLSTTARGTNGFGSTGA